MSPPVVISHKDLQSQLKQAAFAFAKSDDYHHLRPKYTVESAEYLLRKIGVFSGDNEVIQSDTSGPVTVVELGCGTGLLTIAMVGALKGKKNVRFIATDPTECMRQTFAKILPEVEFVACKAEDLPFPDSSVRAFVAGASFHWFANQKAYEELYRVLEPSGMLGYISNLPSETKSADEWVKEMYVHLWDSYKRTGAPFEHDYNWRKALLASDLFVNYEEDFSLDYIQDVTLEECVQCFTSFGGVASGGIENQRNFSTKLAEVLKKHYTDKGVEFNGIQHTTEIYTSQSKKAK